VAALAPKGCWISQWRVARVLGGNLRSVQGVLNDGSTLPPLDDVWGDKGEATLVEEADGIFSELRGR
jgi:hypothetical protein